MSRRKKRNRDNLAAQQQPVVIQGKNQKKAIKQAKVNQAKKKADVPTKRFIVPLEEWNLFQRFKELLPHIQEGMSDLQEDWSRHITNVQTTFSLLDEDFEAVNDDVQRLVDLLRGVDVPRRSDKVVYHDRPEGILRASFANNRPKKKYENMVAEIIIEDITGDGTL